jgi:hypothetical protein
MVEPVVELLYFEGCPNHHGARELVERVAAEVGVTPDVRLVEVPTPEAAEQMRFLGSPTIRVNGRDVEPAADERDQFRLACRVYGADDGGFSGQPAEAWVRAALVEAD